MSTSPAVSAVWRVVFQKCGGKLYIHHLNLHLSDNGFATFQKLRKMYHQTRGHHPYNYWDRASFFWKPIVEVATLSTVSPIPELANARRKADINPQQNSTHDLEKQKSTRQVFVVDRQEDLELTAAFHDPHLLAQAKDFVKDNTRFTINNTSPSVGKDALLIGLRVNWIGVFILVFLNLFICLGSGIIVGYFTRRVDLGVAVTSGVAAVVACIQAVLVLLYK
ncbi:hypothetical protein BDZ45DRAFT_282619 [Acephala macrosclerotiorum]|nr:hypothetical protein BDZ45DRAFT_282619 [Acephala macrosclerotiorum]